MTTPQAALDQLCTWQRETALLAAAESLLGWDEQTLLPKRGGDFRADQLALLSGMVHRRRTDARIGEWLNRIEGSDLLADPRSHAATIVRDIRRQYDKQRKLPQRLVEEIARVSTLAQQVWIDARKRNDYATFAPHVARTFELQREMAEALALGDCLYDSLLDGFEPGAKTSEVAATLSGLRNELAPLIARIAGSGRKVDDGPLRRGFPIDAQREFAVSAATAIGFDFDRGRLDVTAHPFCAMVGPHDTRMTTRFDERFFPSAFFSVLHETGHGIYDQGLRTEWYGLPPGTYVSLGIHESQSRMWENLVGRGRPFWRHFYPKAQQAFPSLGDVSFDAFHGAINRVEPSLIRVEADEATYNLHIIVRFELEQALISRELSVADLPGAWNEKYKKLLGVDVPNDALGCMQDIHWAGGLVGYFPTYSLGNLYASQFFEAAERELGALGPMFERGEFMPLKEWLNRKIHERGRELTATELLKDVAGETLGPAALMRHLNGKLAPLYGL